MGAVLDIVARASATVGALRDFCAPKQTITGKSDDPEWCAEGTNGLNEPPVLAILTIG